MPDDQIAQDHMSEDRSSRLAMDDDRKTVTKEFLEALTRASRKLRTEFNARVVAHGLTYARARTLMRLAERSGMTQKDLACELELEQATTGRLLDRMEALDLVGRVADPNDRRAKLIVLTEHGAVQAKLVEQISQQIRDALFCDLPVAQLTETIKVLGAVEATIGGMSDQPGTNSS